MGGILSQIIRRIPNIGTLQFYYIGAQEPLGILVLCHQILNALEANMFRVQGLGCRPGRNLAQLLRFGGWDLWLKPICSRLSRHFVLQEFLIRNCLSRTLNPRPV